MTDNLLDRIPEEQQPNDPLFETAETFVESSESLLNSEDLKNANDEIKSHLSVYDVPDITPASEYVEYPNGIPPYEIQAQIVFDNYMNNTNRFLSGREKRKLYRECMRNAKKGRYNYMFDREKIAKRQERMRKNFEKLNKPQ